MKFQSLLTATLLTCSLASFSVFAEGQQHDGEALGWLIAVDKSEIAAGNEAKHRKMDDKVVEYAELMVDEHSKNLDQTMDLIKKTEINPVKTKATMEMEKKGKSKQNRMNTMNDKKFQAEYVTVMIKDHGDALDTLDKYLSNVQNSDVKEHLTETRKHIAEHLEKAKELKKAQKN